MPIRWGGFQSGWDKFLTPVDRLIRDWRLLAAMAVVLGAIPPLLGLLWVYVLHDLTIRWFGVDPIQWFLSHQITFSILMMVLGLVIIVHIVPACILFERKISAYIQDRYGPNRAGFWGWAQSFVDGGKMFFKEDVIPGHVDKPIFILAPAIAMAVALCGFIVIPFGGEIVWPWKDADGNWVSVTTQAAQLDVGILFILAIGSLGPYGVVLAGWASNSKYSFYGGMRATAQMLSYEIPLGLAAVLLILVFGTPRLEVMLDTQAATGLWTVFLHPLAFLIMLIAAFAETNRAPFDVVECEQELVGGYHTEYSSMKFGMFFLGEYAHMTTNSAVIVCVFLGGWEPLPFVSFSTLLGEHANTWWAAILKFHVFWAKVALMLFIYMHVRWTLPRFRFDQIMRLAWKALVPAGMVLIVAAAALQALDFRIDPQGGLTGNLGTLAISLAVNLAILAGALFLAARSKTPVTGRQENLPAVDGELVAR